jgi:signal transduction histidine kinase/ActR/RegA family two-component response regulator
MDDGGFSEGLATQQATARHWRIVLTVVGLATLAAAAALWAPNLLLPAVPAVLPAYGTCVTVTDLLTSYLMFTQFSQVRRFPLALLGGAYLFSGLMVWPHLLFFPGVFSPDGLFGAGPQSAVWMWALWHGGFILFIVGFILGGGLAGGRRLDVSAVARLRLATVTMPPLIVVGLAVLVTRGQTLLPDLLRADASGLLVFAPNAVVGLSPTVVRTVVGMVVVGCVVSILVAKRCRRVIDLGLAVALYAMMLDGMLNVAGDTRFSLGWYVGRGCAVLSSCAVLVVYLNEMTRLYFKVVETNRDLEAKTAELIAAKEGAEAANRSKSAFLATMSHEIRTPINAILGLAHLLEGTGLEGERRDFVGKIDAAGRSLLSIVNDVLDVSRVEAGRLELDYAPFDLDDILAGLTTIISVAAKAKGIDLRVVVDPEVPRHLGGDGYRLQQILINIAGNAVKFTEAGGVSVRATLEKRTESRAWIRFQVDDTGIGIPTAKLPGLFEAFAQADSSTTRRYGGSGLGLTIAKRLVELMGGAIGADSEVGRGSRFWLAVSFDIMPPPRQTDARRNDTLVDDAKDAAPATVGDGIADVRVLIVEDNSVNQEIMCRMLERRGAKVAVADNGREAVEQLRVTPDAFDVVLMDVQMPVMDGYEATQAIRGELGLTSLPIIAVTAGVMASERETALRAGMTDFLGKPCGATDLVRVIRQHVPRIDRPND